MLNYQRVSTHSTRLTTKKKREFARQPTKKHDVSVHPIDVPHSHWLMKKEGFETTPPEKQVNDEPKRCPC